MFLWYELSVSSNTDEPLPYKPWPTVEPTRTQTNTNKFRKAIMGNARDFIVYEVFGQVFCKESCILTYWNQGPAVGSFWVKRTLSRPPQCCPWWTIHVSKVREQSPCRCTVGDSTYVAQWVRLFLRSLKAWTYLALHCAHLRPKNLSLLLPIGVCYAALVNFRCRTLISEGKYYILQQIISNHLQSADNECTTYTTSLMDQVEQVHLHIGNAQRIQALTMLRSKLLAHKMTQ